MWKLRIEDDQSNRTVVSLVRKRYTIGRAEANAVRLTERNVSRDHAVLERRGEGWVLRDLDSDNGSFVNDQRVSGELEVGHASRIRIGDYAILLYDDALGEVGATNTSAMTLPAAPPAKSLTDRLIVLEGPDVGAEYPLGERRILLGRGEECDVSLNDTSVSRVHADIELDESGRYRIGDQASSNGVRVNGMEVKSTTLYSGDIIELGDVRLRFVPKGQTFTQSEHPGAARSAGFWGQLGRAPKLGMLAGGALLGAWLFFRSGGDTEERSQSAATGATAALQDAQRHFSQGRLDEAHVALQGIRADSNLRRSPTFRSIERAWAEKQLSAASRTADPGLKRQLLDAVARAASVDAAQRREALEQLSKLNRENLDPTHLPRANDAGADDTATDLAVDTTEREDTTEPDPATSAPRTVPAARVVQRAPTLKPSTPKPKPTPKLPEVTEDPQPSVTAPDAPSPSAPVETTPAPPATPTGSGTLLSPTAQGSPSPAPHTPTQLAPPQLATTPPAGSVPSAP